VAVVFEENSRGGPYWFFFIYINKKYIVVKKVTRMSFASRGSVRKRMAKEWANKDRYNPSHGVPKPHMPLPRGKVVVRSVPAWGDASSRSR
jgi:hypothetical protein